MSVITTPPTPVQTPGAVLPSFKQLTISESETRKLPAANEHLDSTTTLTITGLEALLARLGLKLPIPPFASADVLNKPLDIGRSYLADILTSIIKCDSVIVHNSIKWPNNIYSGDLTVILPKLNHGGDYKTLAINLIQNFPQCPLFNTPFQDGVYLRIKFNPQTLPRLLFPYINDRKDSYGRDIALGLQEPSSPELGSKKVVVEFSSPNIASEFMGKHLRSTILGACISNLYESMGWNVTKINYLGDWGKPIGLLGVGWEKFGSEELYQADAIGHLLDIYHKMDELFTPEQIASKMARKKGEDPAEIESKGLFAERNAFFKRMEDGDETALKLWKRVRDVSIKNYRKLYSRLNVTFDEYSGESRVNPKTMIEIEEILKNKGLCDESGGSLMVDIKRHTGRAADGVGIIRDRTGSSTYLLRDLAAVLERARKYAFDKMIYVAADDNTAHFSRLFKVLEIMDISDLASKLQHISFNEASKMSEKMGRGHMLGDILDECQIAMHNSLKDNPEKAALLGNMEETATAVGITALLTQELSAKRTSDHAFEINRMTSFESGTGPDLQYWYARLCSILKTSPATNNFSDEDMTSLQEDDEFDLVRLLIQYPDITHSAYKTLEPSTILAYLFNITTQLSYCFDEGQDVNGPSPAQSMLCEATRRVLENGMNLLGIAPVAKV